MIETPFNYIQPEEGLDKYMEYITKSFDIYLKSCKDYKKIFKKNMKNYTIKLSLEGERLEDILISINGDHNQGLLRYYINVDKYLASEIYYIYKLFYLSWKDTNIAKEIKLEVIHNNQSTKIRYLLFNDLEKTAKHLTDSVMKEISMIRYEEKRPTFPI